MHISDCAELRCLSNFTFLRGASQRDELVARAERLGYTALAIADECSLAGIVRAHVAAKYHQLQLLVGAQFQVDWGLATTADTAPFCLTLLACNLHGYGNLCQFIIKLRCSSEKGTYHLDIADIAGADLADCVVVMNPQRMCSRAQLQTAGAWLLQHFMGRGWLGVDLRLLMDDEMSLHRLRDVSGCTCRLRDPFGHAWLLGDSIEKVEPEEMQRRYTAMMAG